ncbi:PLD nuclease N-terminal domain-containing protein [Nocardiopsis chromatogenes]|uniref:PLD nuclease N-terminal domain-containing protein n=1 Tax=Nocardiopsis chromatogenes TaxID=280239 RepID=UPI00034BE08E|nr:PLD nuclease N-terminal domain-containing protein [Nocardiopsis chromatogenes]
MPALEAAPLADLLPQYGGIALLLLTGFAMLAYVVFIVAAFLGSLTSRLDVGMKLVWAIFIICAPFLGALCWFLIGRRSAAATAR